MTKFTCNQNKLLTFIATFACIFIISEQKLFAQIFSINESFEDTAFAKNWRREEKCCDFSIRQTDSVAHTGKHAIRFEVNRSDKSVANGKRAELVWKPEKKTNIDRWFSFSIFLPGNYEKDNPSDILAQWHETPDTDLGESWRSAPIALKTQNGYWRASILWSADKVNTDKSIAGKQNFALGKQDKDQWTNWVFHIRFSCYDDGLVEIWKNGEQVLNYPGPNYYNDKKGPFFKFGIYKPDWKNKASKSTVTKRVVFFDDVIIGNENANLKMIQALKTNKPE